ncbi:MAG: glycosyltransferase, partial [Bacteroidetes bacterium]|nr:glycosyltransferase [Bacteroidota bacterium]
NPDEFEVPNKKSDSETVKILHSGRVVTTKGVPDLIRVFYELSKDHDQIELHVAGDGEELDKCRELVDQHGIEDKVTFHGFVSQEKVKSLLADTDIFVLNSRTDDDGDMEGTPVSILEAMCMGKAVVSTIHAGIPYVIEHGTNGMLAHEYSNDELKECIAELINKPAMRKQIGEQARRTVEKSHTVDVMQNKINAIVDSIGHKS